MINSLNRTIKINRSCNWIMRQALPIMPCPDRSPQRQHLVRHRNKSGPGETRTTPGQTKHMITVKEGQAVWFSSDSDFSATGASDTGHIKGYLTGLLTTKQKPQILMPPCSWTLQIGAWGRQRFLPASMVVSTQSITSTCSYACSKVLVITRNYCTLRTVVSRMLVTYLIRSVHHSAPATWTNFFTSTAGWMNKQDLWLVVQGIHSSCSFDFSDWV